MHFLLRYLTIVSAAMLAGASLLISVVEHPARLASGVTVGLQQFRKSYTRGTPLQLMLSGATLAGASALAIWERRWGWLMGGVLSGAAIPFTMLFLMPINRPLIDIRAPLREDAAKPLLEKWGYLHAVRTVLAVLGFLCLLLFALRES